MTNETLEFPQSFSIKLIVENILTDKENKDNINSVLLSENIEGSNWKYKLSKEGKYLSYSVEVTLLDKEQMDRLYEKIKQIPHLKYAL